MYGRSGAANRRLLLVLGTILVIGALAILVEPTWLRGSQTGSSRLEWFDALKHQTLNVEHGECELQCYNRAELPKINHGAHDVQSRVFSLDETTECRLSCAIRVPAPPKCAECPAPKECKECPPEKQCETCKECPAEKQCPACDECEACAVCEECQKCDECEACEECDECPPPVDDKQCEKEARKKDECEKCEKLSYFTESRLKESRVYPFPMSVLRNGEDQPTKLYSSDIKHLPFISHEIAKYQRVEPDILKARRVTVFGGNLLSNDLDLTKQCEEIDVFVTDKASDKTCMLVYQTEGEAGARRVSPRFQRRESAEEDGSFTFEPQPELISFREPCLSTAAVNQKVEYLKSLYIHEAELLDLVRTSLAGIDEKRPVIVMVANAGHFDLLVNWMCSLRASGHDVDRILQQVVVFSASESVHVQLKAIGVRSIFEPEKMAFKPIDDAARAFGDATFVRILYIKCIAPYLVARLGHDVFFQDVDLVWSMDVLEFIDEFVLKARQPDTRLRKPKKGPLSNRPGATGGIDAIFMDDSNHMRFQEPFYINSGFFYTAANPRTLEMYRRMLESFEKVMCFQSQQAALELIMGDMFSLGHLGVDKFPIDLFANGAVYQGRDKATLKGEPWVKAVRDRTEIPVAVHVNWAENKGKKLVMLRAMDLYFVQDNAIDSSGAWKFDGVMPDSFDALFETKCRADLDKFVYPFEEVKKLGKNPMDAPLPTAQIRLEAGA